MKGWPRTSLLNHHHGSRDWLPEDHLVWFVLDVVVELDLAALLLAGVRVNKHSSTVYDPAMMSRRCRARVLHWGAFVAADRAASR